MTMAQLYINGGQTDLAKSKLQEILDTYPDDPLAPKAKTMLDQLNGQ
jgi:TolA-binding protein